MTDVFLSRIAYALGDPGDLDELPEITGPPGVADRLRDGGLAGYRRTDRQAWELAATSGRITLDAAPGIGSVVYATDTFRPRHDPEIAAARFLNATGLGRIPLVGVGYAGCANLALATRTAAALLRAGDTDSALLVTTDVCEPGQRLLTGGIAVLSDGAASCVATTIEPETGFRIIGQVTAIEASLHGLSADDESMAMATATGRGVSRVTTALYASTGLSAGDFAYLVTNNYVASSLRIFAGMAGIGFDRSYRATAADVGHCYAADPLISLAAMAEDGTLRAGRPRPRHRHRPQHVGRAGPRVPLTLARLAVDPGYSQLILELVVTSTACRVSNSRINFSPRPDQLPDFALVDADGTGVGEGDGVIGDAFNAA
jgi:3-oxoacyl-[acyl-carrier-protein] synthase-3